MADDFVLQTRQIAQYPLVTSAAPADVFLVQQGGLGGPYKSISGASILNTALDLGGFIQLAPGSGIAWNGAALTWLGGEFNFTTDVHVPSLHSDGDIFVAGIALANQVEVTGLFDTLLENSVWTFNGRKGNVLLEDVDILRAGGILQTNPHFHGVVTAPTLWNPADASDSVATTAWVQSAIINAGVSGALVRTFNGRGGCVVLNAADITAALTVPGVYAQANTPPSGDASKRLATTMFVDLAIGDLQSALEAEFAQIATELDQTYAPLNSPQFTGIPTAPTAAQTNNSGQLATTAFVHSAVTASTTGVSSWNGRTGIVVLTTADITGAGGAPIASPAFTGTPTTATTPAPGDNTTKLATTAFVQAAITAMAAGVSSFNTRVGAVVLTAADVTGVGGALLASPAFSGAPTAPTPAPTDNSNALATTAYVTHAISVLPAPVTSFNGRAGAVSFQASDISAVGGALLAGPAFTGVPTAPTATVGTANTQLATTQFVATAVAAATGGVSSFNTRTGAVTLTAADITAAGGALLAGPTFTGVPAAPTATAGTNSTQLATCAFVQAALAAAPGGVSSFNSRTGAITLLGADVSAAGGAMIASPSFSGTPTAPTPSPGANNTQLATTAFVTAALAGSGGVSSFNGRAGAVTLNASDIVGVAGGVLMTVAAAPPTGTPATGNQALWWDSLNGQLYVNYNDGTSTQWVVANSPQPAPAPAVRQFITYTTPGSASLTAAQLTGVSYIKVWVIGGGGGGGGGYNASPFYLGTGGCGGGAACKIYPVSALTLPVPITVGAAGLGGHFGSANTAGGNGGTTSFGASLQATGGGGGSNGTVNNTAGFVPPGVGSGGDLNFTGGVATAATSSSYSAGVAPSGGAAGGGWGQGAWMGTAVGLGYGGGGGPGNQVTDAVANGQPGACLIEVLA